MQRELETAIDDTYNIHNGSIYTEINGIRVAYDV